MSSFVTGCDARYNDGSHDWPSSAGKNDSCSEKQKQNTVRDAKPLLRSYSFALFFLAFLVNVVAGFDVGAISSDARALGIVVKIVCCCFWDVTSSM